MAATRDSAGPLTALHGRATHPGREVASPRPRGMSDATVDAMGKLSEALEVVEQARGMLYAFHRLCGTADLTLQRALAMLSDAGHGDLATDIGATLVGRDVVAGWWSLQLVEAYDQGYWNVFRDAEAHARKQVGLARHVYEAEMKHREQSGRGDAAAHHT